MAQAELQRRHPRARWVDDDAFYADGWWLRGAVSWGLSMLAADLQPTH